MSGLAQPAKLNLHVVIAVRSVETTAGQEVWGSIVAGPTDWGRAQDCWSRLDERRSRGRRTTYYKVRSIHDPEVAPLLAQCSFHKSSRLAAQAWGRANAVAGNKGGWILGIGGGVQGWGSAALALARDGHIGQGQHPRSGKHCWVNYGAVTVKKLRAVKRRCGTGTLRPLRSSEA